MTRSLKASGTKNQDTMHTQQNVSETTSEQSEPSSKNASAQGNPDDIGEHVEANSLNDKVNRAPVSIDDNQALSSTQPVPPPTNPDNTIPTQISRLLALTKRIEESQRLDREALLTKMLRQHRSTSKKIDDLKDELEGTRGVVDCLHLQIKPSEHDHEDGGLSLSERIDEILDEVLGSEERMEGLENRMVGLREAEERVLRVVREMVGKVGEDLAESLKPMERVAEKVVKIGEDLGYLTSEPVQHESYKSPVQKRIEAVEGKVDEILKLLKEGRRGEKGEKTGSRGFLFG
jgi:hypothetical protein